MVVGFSINRIICKKPKRFPKLCHSLVLHRTANSPRPATGTTFECFASEKGMVTSGPVSLQGTGAGAPAISQSFPGNFVTSVSLPLEVVHCGFHRSSRWVVESLIVQQIQYSRDDCTAHQNTNDRKVTTIYPLAPQSHLWCQHKVPRLIKKNSVSKRYRIYTNIH